ncbi:MAG: hypothetical protein JW900_03560 [Anaerolineae bacterium]|nr:hypothetical protein [Anaerolineae bacterium]
MSYRIADRLLTLGAIAGIVGGVAPWIPHRAAGLNIGGFALFESSKFLPLVRSGEVPLWREAFLLPLLTMAVLLATSTAILAAQSRPRRWILPLIAAPIALAALPPYPAILTAHQNPEYQGQLLLALAALSFILAGPWIHHLPRPSHSILAVLFVLGGLVPALLNLARVRPLFARLYDAPVGIGWGTGIYLLGCVMVLAGVILAETAKRPAIDAGLFAL